MSILINDAEYQRIQHQERIDNSKTLEDRNKLGQYSTPPQLAEEVTSFVLKFWAEASGYKEISFLEPALGTGSFYSAVIRNPHCKNIIAATGIELDEQFFEAAKIVWSTNNIEIEKNDYTKFVEETSKKFNLLITNPPYVRHHHISKEEKERLQSLVKSTLGNTISGLAGLYCYFVLLSHKLLLDNAVASWLIPSEYLDVNYGKAVKKYLITSATVTHIHKYDSSESLFDDALVSSSVLVYQKRKPKKDDVVRFSYGGTLENPRYVRLVKISKLSPTDKWSNYFTDEQAVSVDKKATLGDLFTIKRGIATGNNEFFIVDKEKVERLGLPYSCLRPVLPAVRYVNADVIEANELGHPIIDPQLFVIDTELDEEVIKERHPSLWAYLEEGKAKGATESYLASSRKIWYSQEKRDDVPFVCTYMARNRGENNPFKFIRNKSKAIVTNGYLMLYPKGELLALLTSNPELYDEVHQCLQNIGKDELFSEGREYGGGLKKLEPKELSKVSANIFYETILQSLF